MVALLHVAVLIAPIPVVSVAVIAVSQSSDPVSADVVAVRHRDVEEEAFVAGAAFGGCPDVVESGVAGDASEGVVKESSLEAATVTQTVP